VVAGADRAHLLAGRIRDVGGPRAHGGRGSAGRDTERLRG
jgi:hypothetical protein